MGWARDRGARGGGGRHAFDLNQVATALDLLVTIRIAQLIIPQEVSNPYGGLYQEATEMRRSPSPPSTFPRCHGNIMPAVVFYTSTPSLRPEEPPDIICLGFPMVN